MWYHEYITIGHRVERSDNPRHQGRVDAISKADASQLLKLATFRVTWDNGWKEDCAYDDIRRIFEPRPITPSIRREAARVRQQELEVTKGLKP